MVRPCYPGALLTVGVIFTFLSGQTFAANVPSGQKDAELRAREILLSQLPPSVRADLETRDPSEYELGHEDILARTEQQQRDFWKRAPQGRHPDGSSGTSNLNLNSQPWRQPYNRQGYIGGYWTECQDGQSVAVTIDDGPNENWQKVKEKAIDKYNAQGDLTHFTNGFNYVCIYEDNYKDWCRGIIDAGGILGGHSWSHVDFLYNLTTAQVDEQVGLLEEALYKQKWGYEIVHWSKQTGDADGASKTDQLKVWRGVKPTDILLVHEQALEGLEEGMRILYEERKMKSVPIDKCLGLKSPYKIKAKPKAKDSTWTCDGKPIPGKGYGIPPNN
ncbi:hypothetical protein FA10DRAFT_290230 [Acaromyces ingoldii]|uniref:NodB homology domain-containing protein n=1 Tax=Acaromyces ingoldii TaxID=215250 RepID=A0A316YVF1_9BASI|nr:hypothetical protein FA10DRAFT_290230 [Acaromyces ingoldii]PWN93092.1 hypothetical protein FA10DRAFT_290230 [Acaromyces ingoldii]